MRKIILTILGLLIIIGAVFIARQLAAMKEEIKPVEQKVVSSVYAQTVENTSSSITISTSGSLMANGTELIYLLKYKVFLNPVPGLSSQAVISVKGKRYYCSTVMNLGQIFGHRKAACTIKLSISFLTCELIM